MSRSEDSAGAGNRSTPQWFATTHWSVVLAARDGGSPGASEALNDLCRAYWPPLYAYIRRQGHDVAESVKPPCLKR